MKKTVLQLVQKCLSSMDSDAVDSINDTEEATQVADLLEDVYYEILERGDWAHLRGAVELTGVGDPLTPTFFILDDIVMEMEMIQYNVAAAGQPAEMRELTYCKPDDFLRLHANGNASTVQVEFDGNLIFHVRNDQHPTYWTTFDDVTIVCNAYDASVESTLTSERVTGLGLKEPTFSRTDGFTPDLPSRMFPHLQHTLNAAAHLLFKQQASPVDEARVQRQLAQIRRKGSRTQQGGNKNFRNKFGRK